MNMMRAEVEDIKNDSCLQSLGRSSMTTMSLKSVGTSVGKCSCTICYNIPSQPGREAESRLA